MAHSTSGYQRNAESRAWFEQFQDTRCRAERGSTPAEWDTNLAVRRVPGIGPIIALTILAEGGDLRRFGHLPVLEVLRA
jgi:transposase